MYIEVKEDQIVAYSYRPWVMIDKLPLEVYDETHLAIFYESRNDLSYSVEYYFDGVKDDSLTDVFENKTFETEITTYTDKVKPGYKLDRVETLPLTITTGENKIKVFYVTDDSQTKELSYTVEYYKDGVLEDTDVEKMTVQYLAPNTKKYDSS